MYPEIKNRDNFRKEKKSNYTGVIKPILSYGALICWKVMENLGNRESGKRKQKHGVYGTVLREMTVWSGIYCQS